MTKSPTALERARELYVASFPDAHESWNRAILAGAIDNDDWLRGALAAFTSAEAERRAQCYDCGQLYDDPAWIEAVVPHAVWNNHLSPRGNEGGLLCIGCMAKRAVAAGLTNIPVELAAGPFILTSAEAERDAVIEVCAKVADDHALDKETWGATNTIGRCEHLQAITIAAAIRSLKDSPNDQ